MEDLLAQAQGLLHPHSQGSPRLACDVQGLGDAHTVGQPLPTGRGHRGPVGLGVRSVTGVRAQGAGRDQSGAGAWEGDARAWGQAEGHMLAEPTGARLHMGAPHTLCTPAHCAHPQTGEHLPTAHPPTVHTRPLCTPANR